MVRASVFDGKFVMVGGGISVYFDAADWGCERRVDSVDLSLRGRHVCCIYVFDKGGKARVKELKRLGFLK